MKKWMMALAFGCLIVSFQNCSRGGGVNSGSLDQSSQINPVTENAVTGLKPNEAEALVLPNTPFLDAQLQIAESKAADANPFDSSTLSMDPKTGVMNVVSADGSVDPDKIFCLSSEQIAELEGLLSAAQICAGEDKAASADVVCQMDYQFPYAKLQFSDQDVTLGERFSGCHTGTDLCGQSSRNLQKFIADVVKNLPAQTCHFESL
jgi:hypothetical protein